MQRVILITGCSSGIGAAMASELHRRGQRVYATARRPESLAPLAEQGLQTLALDVNDDASIATAMAAVQAREGRLDMLVNNAGFSQVGAVVDLSRETLRRQYETNVIAPVAVTRAALPLLRAGVAAGGRATLVNVGSIVGLFTTPFAGAYCSSKAALHSLSDALRMELAPFGIQVVMIQPGGVRSAFGDHAQESIALPEDSVYQPVRSGIEARSQAGQQGATPVEEFVVPVVDKLLGDTPPPIIRGGKNSTRLPLLKKLLPLRTLDRMASRLFGLDRFKP
ncbi:MAG: SDR family oxidoreductase [Halieaceae bacterium]|nr:SDR family oxidoreductase [Halieaceae bacterium]